MIDIYTFADICNLSICLTRYPNQQGRWSARFENTDVKDGSVLIGTYGDGKNPTEAVDSYWHAVRGKTLVYAAGSKGRRREFTAPGAQP